jgi:hypothetical protein
MRDPDDWSRGWGLGLELVTRNGRVYGGHGGAMPGFLAGLVIHRGSGVGAVALTNAGTRGAMSSLALELVDLTLEHRPDELEPWRPESEPPSEVASLLGVWWSEGEPFAFRWRDGKLQAEPLDAPAWVKPAVFEQIGALEYRVVSGYERGERLRVEEGRLVWSGYPFTREQRPFD